MWRFPSEWTDPTKPHPHVGYRSNLCELCKKDSRHDIHRDPHAIDMSQSPGPRPDARKAETCHTYGSRGWYDSDESYLGEAPPQDPCRIW